MSNASHHLVGNVSNMLAHVIAMQTMPAENEPTSPSSLSWKCWQHVGACRRDTDNAGWKWAGVTMLLTSWLDLGLSQVTAVGMHTNSFFLYLACNKCSIWHTGVTSNSIFWKKTNLLICTSPLTWARILVFSWSPYYLSDLSQIWCRFWEDKNQTNSNSR